MGNRGVRHAVVKLDAVGMFYLGEELQQGKSSTEIHLRDSLGNSILARFVVVSPHRARNGVLK